MEKNLVLVSGAIVFKEYRRKIKWFLVRHGEDGDWEIPKVVVRKVESSVRAILRMMGEQGGMSIKVLEEAGRAGGSTSINDKVLPQRYIYYLAVLLSSEGEPVGFEKGDWLKYADAVRRLPAKRERMMIKQARKEFRKWKKEQEKLQKDL
jgi:hypothetical protein